MDGDASAWEHRGDDRLLWHTDAEREILQNSPKADMPNQMAVKLKAGDIVFYNSSLFHKGCSKSGAKRQTLHYALRFSRGQASGSR